MEILFIHLKMYRDFKRHFSRVIDLPSHRSGCRIVQPVDARFPSSCFSFKKNGTLWKETADFVSWTCRNAFILPWVDPWNPCVRVRRVETKCGAYAAECNRTEECSQPSRVESENEQRAVLVTRETFVSAFWVPLFRGEATLDDEIEPRRSGEEFVVVTEKKGEKEKRKNGRSIRSAKGRDKRGGDCASCIAKGYIPPKRDASEQICSPRIPFPVRFVSSRRMHFAVLLIIQANSRFSFYWQHSSAFSNCEIKSSNNNAVLITIAN